MRVSAKKRPPSPNVTGAAISNHLSRHPCFWTRHLSSVYLALGFPSKRDSAIAQVVIVQIALDVGAYSQSCNVFPVFSKGFVRKGESTVIFLLLESALSHNTALRGRNRSQ